MPPKPPPLTHFLAIPLVTSASRPHLAAKLAAFRADPVVASSIPPDAIRPLGTLHLTLGVFSFPPTTTPPSSSAASTEESGPERLARACLLLKSLPLADIWRGAGRIAAGRQATDESADDETIDSPVRVVLSGLRCMTPGREADARVLYAPVADADKRVQVFCEAVRRAFQREGLMVEEGRGLVLHATVVNTVYCKGRGKKGRERVTVDAREVLERWEQELWVDGGIEVEGVAICKMGARRVEEEGWVLEEERLGEEYVVVERVKVKQPEEGGGWAGSIPMINPFDLF